MFSAISSVAEAQPLLQLHYLAWIAAGKCFARLASSYHRYATYVLLYRAVVYPCFFSPLRNVPGPSMGSPVFGQGFVISKKETCIPQREWAKQYGPVVRWMWPFRQECLVFLSPEALQQIMVKDWLEYPRPRFLRDILGLVAGHGLLTITGDAHKRLRKAMNPAFSIPNLIAQTDMYYEHIEGLVEILKGQIEGEAAPEAGKVFQVYRWMSKVTLDIICDIAFGYKTDCLHNPSNELAVAYEQMQNLQSGENLALFIAIVSIPGAARAIASDWLHRYHTLLGGIPILRRLEPIVDSMHRIRTISQEMLRAKKADLSVAPDDLSTKQDILSLIMRAHKAELEVNPIAEPMSDMAMVDQVITFLITGHEPIALGLSWTLWLLANDPASQRRLREEVTPVYAANPRPDYRTLKSLEWLDCVVNESLRVLPPVPQTVRVAGKTDYIEGVLVPKGTNINIPIRVINTWKQVWGENAEEFHPARWLNLPEAYNPTFSQFSFITGPHGCFGKTMAVSEMKAVLAALITNFEFAPAYVGQIAHPTAALTMKPDDNMPLRVSRIKA
ncbi:cytochrome P450 [Mycena capillaripes]|nr:cytochrome P450 [Mycena capillaripes]